jgi:hypothetical protein
MSEGTTVHPELMTKLHELLELALHDMELFEQQPDCHVDMDTWLRPGWPDEGENPKHCYACLAGTVWRMTLGLEDTPSATAPNWANALNQLRYGRVSDAYFYLPVW